MYINATTAKVTEVHTIKLFSKNFENFHLYLFPTEYTDAASNPITTNSFQNLKISVPIHNLHFKKVTKSA